MSTDRELKASELIPQNWLDPILTGKDAVIGKPPYSGADVEMVLNAIKKRILEWESRPLRPEGGVREKKDHELAVCQMNVLQMICWPKDPSVINYIRELQLDRKEYVALADGEGLQWIARQIALSLHHQEGRGE